jgi:hypothetical protein
MSRPVDPRAAALLDAAEAQAATDPGMAALLRELDEAITAAERRVARAPLRRRRGSSPGLSAGSRYAARRAS